MQSSKVVSHQLNKILLLLKHQSWQDFKSLQSCVSQDQIEQLQIEWQNPLSNPFFHRCGLAAVNKKMAWRKLSRSLLPRKARHPDLQGHTSAISKSWQLRYRLGQFQPSSTGRRPASPSCTPVLMEQPEHWLLLVRASEVSQRFQPQMQVW